MSDSSDENKANLEKNPDTRQYSSFQLCVNEIRRVSIDKTKSDEEKKSICEECLFKYFNNETISDVYEGFLRLIVEFFNFAKEKLRRPNDTFLALRVIKSFYKFHNAFENTIIKNSILLSRPLDKRIFGVALGIVSVCKGKHLSKIAAVFKPDKKEIIEILVPAVMKKVKNPDGNKHWSKAIFFIKYFDIRKYFPFKEIVCNLFMESHFALLSEFIGDDLERQKELLIYFDQLLGNKIFYRLDNLTSYEKDVINESKRLEKFITRSLKAYNISELLTPNTLNNRCKDCLLYHHKLWDNKDITLKNYESIALGAMNGNEFVKSFYLKFLCQKGLHRQALYFAFRMDLRVENYPHSLLGFVNQDPSILEETKNEILRLEKMENQEMENNTNCVLHEGYPINIVDNWEDLVKALEDTQKEDVIGVDAEWRPNFSCMKELAALIQIATSKCVFIIDIVKLEKELSEKQWLEFFTTLFCSEKPLKIGFAFANDWRILKQTFPFITNINDEAQNLICIYRLLTEISTTPFLSSLVFQTDEIQTNINLSQMSEHFLGIKLDKSEQVGNWLERPLRIEQKIYAAFDAYCTMEIFKVISQRLKSSNDQKVLAALQEVALLKTKDSKIKSVMKSDEINIAN